ncbi:MAG: hypothetical protein GY845_25515, partial [Planctomycetes bacterium]|nr:hypothetical protein [Planctomycetota bacterium]
PALDFILQYGDELFPNTPVVFCVIDEHRLQARQLSENMTGSIHVFNVKETWEVALKLQPATRQVIVIFDKTSQPSINMAGAVQQVLKEYETRLEFHYINDLTVEEWQVKAAQLPPQTIILYINLVNGSEGKVYTSPMALSLIAETSNVPIYGFFDTYLGYGIVGGHLSSYEAQGKKAAKLGIQILDGEKPAAIPITADETNIYMFDWKQLKRHNISEDHLPAGSIVIDKQPSIWDLYKWWIVTGIAVLITESLLLMLLLFQRMIRQRAEKELQKYREQLEDLVDERTVALKLEVTEHKWTAKELRKAKESAEAANQAKSNFLSNMSHELRTPLNGVLGYAQILKRDPLTPAKHQHGLDVIEQSGQYLLTLINDVLDLARVEAGQIELYETEFHLRPMLNRVGEVIRLRAE